MTDYIEIGIRDAEVIADIGMLAHEIGRPQTLRISATLRIRMPDADRIDATLDYKRIVEAAESLGGQRIALIETFARRLAEACLLDPRVLQADILVEKPQALASGKAFARIELHRSA
ncbi:dihydroneopterin aldolase [Sphingomonas sp. M1-B02]|uniref:dihydroneopterin aldolase n=1 Tax=Sphingomonas sp. M1-B02 TaxID=3114300 RepID=UPI00223E9234|nr:dihydroneopterin aldolase [Sphingomonas sp. S6-11]UZK65080.1 dihydroneopterin aldolase [Sphingomonas sp. S6-11]